MDGIDMSDSDDLRPRWVSQCTDAILGAIALLALGLAFAIEFVSVAPIVHMSAHKLLSAERSHGLEPPLRLTCGLGISPPFH